MATKLEDQLEELALLSVMLYAGDQQGLDMVLDQIESLATLAADTPDAQRLVDACNALLAERESKSGEDLVTAINNLITAGQNFFKDPDSAVFSNEHQSSPWGDDLSPNADDELIVEFIETHTINLDDLEAELLKTTNQSALEENELLQLERYVKAYLHNVKGDAGSVGLSGIERVTHALEDRLNSASASKLIDEILTYREWIISVMKAYARGEAPEKLSAQLLEELNLLKTVAVATIQEEEQIPADSPAPQAEILSEELAAADAMPEETEVEVYEISGDLDILSEFMVEAEEHLSSIENLLMDKEDGFDEDDLNTIFRAMHSIKGGASYFNLKEITISSHSAENLMDKARNGHLAFNNALKTIVLRYIDVERSLLTETQRALASDGKLSFSAETQSFLDSISDYLLSITMVEELDLDEFIREAAASTPVTQTQIQSESNAQPGTAQSGPVKAKPVTTADNKPNQNDARPSVGTKKAQVKSFVKIETTRLDHLLEYIGEMVISSTMLIKNCRDLLGDHEDVTNNSNQLERISREVQEIGMSMRLIPIKGLFQKMSRVVWDTAKKLNKDIRFEMEGEDTELDRTVIEKLADPLMHMLRNAADHGVESIEDREKAGKPRQGAVKVAAYQSGGSIIIEIKDDGKGLDAEKLKTLAREKGIIDEKDNLSDEEAYMLIFAPGFSTATEVTDVSGRGVGMDVVRRNIESMRGRVSIASKIGAGSTFTIELPLTLAIMEGIETEIGSERFIIPSLSIVEFLRPTEDMIMHTLDRGETLKYRDMFIPIFRISDLYNINSRYSNLTDGILVIVESGNHHVALLVDEVLGKFSAVIKSLGSVFREVEGVSGCAIMPDGSIGLILDVPSLVILGQSSPEVFAEKRTRLPTGETLTDVVSRGERLH